MLLQSELQIIYVRRIQTHKEKYLSSPSKMLQCFPDDELRRKIEKIFIFPNIELRLEILLVEMNSVNYHVIFLMI